MGPRGLNQQDFGIIAAVSAGFATNHHGQIVG